MTDASQEGAPHPPSRPRIWLRPFSGRFGGALLWVLVLVASSTATRVAIAVTWPDQLSWGPSLVAAWGLGAVLDLLSAWVLALPLIVYLALLPQRLFAHPVHRAVVHVTLAVGLFAVGFVATAEWVFWLEFGARFNFIAVDYLMYTYEVIGNIWQSYPIPAILAGLALLAALELVALMRSGVLATWLGSTTRPGRSVAMGALLAVVPLAVLPLVDESSIPAFANAYDRELAKNGAFSFCAALRSQEIDFETFYQTMDEPQALTRARLLTGADPSSFRSTDPYDFVHHTQGRSEERRWNVIQITVESLSTHFLGAFGSPDGLTPNLDRVAAGGLFFTRCFATGTRTTRGMEALTLSLPPTPGQSILRRPGSTGLFNLGSVFRSRGYDTAFLYGGLATFDGMKSFFGGNGYRVVDRASVAADDVTFSTVWGACDEDLLRWTLREADRDDAMGKPFFYFVMTTSNHRPYAYPAGRVDIPSPGGRPGAVKYTDYAIGDFLRQASTRPWFDNTLFVIVADHTASSAGKAELEVRRFHIPWLIYNPKLVQPAQVHTLCSQVDVAPTLLALLGWSYDSPFFGYDVLREDPAHGRAFVANYQRLGLFVHNRVVVLAPMRHSSSFSCDDHGEHLTPAAPDPDLTLDAVAAFESAFILYRNGSLLADAVTTGALPADRLTRSEPVAPRVQTTPPPPG